MVGVADAEEDVRVGTAVDDVVELVVDDDAAMVRQTRQNRQANINASP